MTETTTAIARTPTKTEQAISERARMNLTAEAFGISLPEYVALKDSIAQGATDAEFKAHLLICKNLGLPPIGGQVHFVKRDTRVKENGEWVTKSIFTSQVGIDAYRSLAEDTKEYEGPAGLPLFKYTDDATEGWTDWMDPKKAPVAAKVGVYRKGWREPVYAVALFEQYAQKTKDQDGNWVPTAMWRKMPHPQLAKCAEALALRKAFPRKLGGVYTKEEMEQASTVAPSTNGEVVDAEVVETTSNGRKEPETAPTAETPVAKVDPAAFPPPTEKELAWIKALHATLPKDKQWAPGVRKDKMNRLGPRGVMGELIKTHVALHGADDEHLSDKEMRKALGADVETGEVHRALSATEQARVDRDTRKQADIPLGSGDVDENEIPF